jgi:septal ring factor EnvC (AmiA/AmiB activator)
MEIMSKAKRARYTAAVTIMGALVLATLAGSAGAQENRPRLVAQANLASTLREQPVSPAEVQSLKAQIAKLESQISAIQAVLADTQKTASGAHFMATLATQWIDKNGNSALQAAQWVTSNGAAAQQMVATYPTHTHGYHYLVTNWTNRKFVTDSHVSGDDTAYGSFVSGNNDTSGTTSPPK